MIRMTVLFVRKTGNIITFSLERADIELDITGSRIIAEEETRVYNLVDDYYDDFLNIKYTFTNPEGIISITRNEEDEERTQIDITIKFGRISFKDSISHITISDLRVIMEPLMQAQLQEGGSKKRKRKTRRSRN